MDDNITLVIEEVNYAEMFETDIPDDCSVIDVKINNVATDPSDVELNFFAIPKYIKDLGCEILFSSVGLHLNGDAGVPHCHWNFITTRVAAPSNPSQHRSRWMKKNEELGCFDNVSFKFHNKIDLTKPKYNVLAYPLKEGRSLPYASRYYKYAGQAMTKAQIKFLINIGQEIYNTELAVNMRRDKCEERKKQSLHDLLDICTKNQDKFYDLRSMLVFLDEAYIATIDIDEYPDPRNYKTNCQKIAVKLGKIKYSDIV